MSEWLHAKLCSFVRNVSETYKFSPNEEVVFLNTSDVFQGAVLNNKFEDSAKLPGQAKKRIQKGDFLFSEIRPANGRYALINFDAEKYVVSTKLMVLRCNENIDVNFFRLFLTSQETLDYLQMLAEDRSGTFPQITFDHIASLDIYSPPLPEQKAIASVLSSLDDKIDLLHRQNATLEKMAETLFRQWFIEEAKDDWETSTLSEIAIFLNGLACQKFPPKNDLDKLPVLKIKELSSGISENSDWASTDIKSEYIIKNGDVIFAWSASLMVKIWDGQDCILNQHLFKVTSEKYPKWFYYLWCKYYLAEFISIASSHATTMGHIKRKDLDGAMVAIPSLGEFDVMTSTIEPLIQKIIANNLQLNALVKMRNSLLPKLMGGEVRVEA